MHDQHPSTDQHYIAIVFMALAVLSGLLAGTLAAVLAMHVVA
jgi:hypothetical protein